MSLLFAVHVLALLRSACPCSLSLLFCCGIGCFRAFFTLRVAFLQVADQQFKLLDVVVEFLRGTPEAGTAQQGKLSFQFFDVQGLGVKLRIAGLQFGVACLQRCLKGDGECLQRGKIRREGSGGNRHGFV
jgi:hypothetical protein